MRLLFQQRNQSNLSWSVIVPTVALFFIFIFNILLTIPNIRFWADDFCSSVFLRNNGYFGAQVAWWNSWTGRYSYIAFLDLVLLNGSVFVKLLPIVLLISFIVPLIPVFGVISSLVFSSVVLLNSPNIIQTFYWATGSLNYYIPFVFLNFFLFLLFKKEVKYKNILIFINFLIAGGFSESFAVASLVFFFYLYIFLSFVKHDKIENFKKNILFAVFGVGSSLAIMYLSPGNEVRSSLVSHPVSIFSWARDTFYYSKWFILSRFNIDYFNVSILTIFLLPLLFPNAIDKKIVIKNKNLIMLFLLSFIPVITLTVVGLTYYALNWEPPERVMFLVTTYIFYIFTLFSFVFWHNLNFKYTKYLRVVLTVLILLLTFYVNKYFLINKREIAEYALKWDIIENKILTSNKKDIEVQYIKPVGKLDGFVENKGWVLGCIKGYYNLDSLRVK